MTSRPELIVIAASARALAFSAARAGRRVIAIDLFADADLRRVAACRPVPPGTWPDGVLGSLAGLPRSRVMLGGGLDGRPDLVARIASAHEIVGTGPTALAALLDPARLRRVIRAAGGRTPDTLPAGRAPPRGSSWLDKPIGGSGGLGIRRASRAARRGRFLQREARGEPASAAFFSARGSARLLGATTQLVGSPWLHAPAWAGCGNIGPRPLPSAARRALDRVARALVREYGLRGHFGVDFVRRGEEVEIIEVNPRATASLEVLEEALGWSAAAVALGDEDAAESGGREARGPADDATRRVGRAVVFAPWPAVARAPSPPTPATLRWPDLADVPRPGLDIAPGDPAFTVFARAASERGVIEALARRAREFEARLLARR